MDQRSSPTVYRMLRVTFGIRCSPFLAIATVQHHVKNDQEEYPVAAAQILENMYVDDLLSGASDDTSALKLQQDLTALMKKGGFPLTKWASNSDYVMTNIPVENRNPAALIDSDSSRSLKALGIVWDTNSDSFGYEVTNIMTSQTRKRSVVCLV